MGVATCSDAVLGAEVGAESIAVKSIGGGASKLGGKLAIIPSKTSEKRVFPSTSTWEFSES